MMDHARHLSSPSPTSPFFFHHSERSSAADVTSVVVDDCFPAPENGVDHHHSFSRILLEEYSPLSLGEDCDNALSISPTSLACSSHHSFKSSLNGLKMDTLSMGDVGDVHDDDDDHGDRDGEDNDARSMSPSLMSASVSNHHNLWSNSSTAITQNTSLLNSTSTSFLLSQHHQNQLNSLIQQLEPQSLDESPPLVSHSVGFDSSGALKIAHRPSSEPPPGANGSDSSEIENKSISHQQSQIISKQQSTSSKQTNARLPASSSNRSRSKSKLASSSKSSTNSSKNISNNNVSSANISKKSIKSSDNTSTNSIAQQLQEPAHSSKVHLQLNHYKKLQELQQRLFGISSLPPNAPNSGDNSAILNQSSSQSAQSSSRIASRSELKPNLINDLVVHAKDEPDSSGNLSKNDDTKSVQEKVAAVAEDSTPETKTRGGRSTRSRRSRAPSNVSKVATRGSGSGANTSSTKQTSKSVTTETAEPDTTTKTSDCIKLADLLSNDEYKSNNTSFVVSGLSAAASSETSDSDNGSEKKTQQQIQFQVSPSLTVVANGNLMQPINIQQQKQSSTRLTASNTNSLIGSKQGILEGCTNQIKTVLCSTDDSKSNETVSAGWSAQKGSSGNQTNNIGVTNGSTQTIGAHQIALQVICQDGTSLVLPMNSAASLNAAVSLTSHHQQLQAILANNSNQQRNQNSNQMLQLLSVSNIVAQQQQANYSPGNGDSTSNSTQGTQQLQTSGLAASSPTLAALLDAGSLRTNNTTTATANNDLSNNTLDSNLISSNLLKRLVSGNASELKRGELILQQVPTLSLANCGSLVTVCAANNGNSNKNGANSNNNTCNSNGSNISRGSLNIRGTSMGTSNLSDKRIKLENSDVSSLQTTFSLIDSQGLIVANGNEKSVNNSKQRANTSTSVISAPSSKSSSNSSALGNNVQQNVSRSSVSDVATAVKQSKMGSSTGNRQVDPTQPFRCEHCNSTFTRLGNFTRHKKIHTVPTKDGQRFKCDVCSKSFLQRCDLARHLHIHRGTEPHRCNICGKGYIRHSDLVTHQRFHNKEKPFGCPQCSKGFCQRGDLNRHLRSIHLQMKPILCPCCNRKFAKQETLLRHLNTVHRSKPGATSNNSGTVDSGDVLSNFAVTQLEDKHNTISVVNTNAAVSNNNGMTNIHSQNINTSQKNAQVASLQAIQATICKAQQSADPSITTSGLKADPITDEANTAKVLKMILARVGRASASIINQQSKRTLSIPKDIQGRLMTMRKRALAAAIVELRPPTPVEIPAAIRDGVRLFTRGNWRNLTVREAWLNALVTTEVLCWFFVGECIGKGNLIGYQV